MMAASNNYSVLSVLSPGMGDNTIIVRLLRYWRATNFRRNGELILVGLMLLDEEDTLIQATINSSVVPKFEGLLEEGCLFSISNFDVVTAPHTYRTTENRYMIRYSNRTTMVRSIGDGVIVKKEKFQFRSFEYLESNAGGREYLPDVIAVVSSIVEPDDSSNSTRAMVNVILEGGHRATITAWDDKAFEFYKRLKGTFGDAIVVIATNINPKIFSGGLYLNTTSATALYINGDSSAVSDFRKRMNVQVTSTAIQTFSGVRQATKSTLSDIYTILSTEVEQDRYFLCQAKITDVVSRSGWNYISCSRCSSKLRKSESALTCNKCDNMSALGVLRFRIETIVDDGTDTGTFVIFDGPAKKYTNTTAEDLKNGLKSVMDGENVDEEELPECIRSLVGKIFNFYLRIKPFDFRSSYKSLTVTRMDEIHPIKGAADEKNTVEVSQALSEVVFPLECVLPEKSTYCIEMPKDAVCKPVVESVVVPKDLILKDNATDGFDMVLSTLKRPKRVDPDRIPHVRSKKIKEEKFEKFK